MVGFISHSVLFLILSFTIMFLYFSHINHFLSAIPLSICIFLSLPPSIYILGESLFLVIQLGVTVCAPIRLSFSFLLRSVLVRQIDRLSPHLYFDLCILGGPQVRLFGSLPFLHFISVLYVSLSRHIYIYYISILYF